MVSKRKSTNGNEAGSSKKKIKSDEKIKTEETPPSPPKKRVKKQKVAKENIEENVQSEAVSDRASDTSDDEVIDVKQEIPEEFNITEMNTKTNQLNSDLPDWPVEHMSELLRRLEDALPVHEQLTYKSRIEKINWNEIAFENYSGAECRLMWDAIQKRVRRYRILKELIEDAKMWVSKPWTNFYRGSKTNRHPDHPRRPLSTYMIFYLKKKDKVLQENPGLDMTELSKHIAEMYKKLSVKSKFKYKEMAAEQRREYEEKMKEFSRLHPELVRTTAKKEKKVAATAHDNAPPKPLTPFKLFYEDKLKRVEHEENFDEGAFKEKCKGQWRNMSEKKKVFWINWSLDKEAKYQEELKKYVAENPNFVPVAFKSVVTKEERCIKERMAGKPEKPPNSAYSLFSRLMLVSEDVKRVTPKERMLLIAQQWRNCTEAEKKEYGDRVKHMLDQYKLQYAEYLESLPEEERQTELLKNQPKKRVTAAKQKKIKSETVNKKRKKKVNTPKLKKKLATITSNKKQSKNSNLYEGEPEPPPTTPYLLFVKSYQASYPDRNDAQETWENMTEDQRSFHRQVLWDLKKVYIESYENFLKGLTQEELKEYSEWKKTAKLTTQDSASSDEESSASDAECSANSESDNEEIPIKTEDPDDSDTSD